MVYQVMMAARTRVMAMTMGEADGCGTVFFQVSLTFNIIFYSFQVTA